MPPPPGVTPVPVPAPVDPAREAMRQQMRAAIRAQMKAALRQQVQRQAPVQSSAPIAPQPAAQPVAAQQPGVLDRVGSWMRENVFDPSSVAPMASQLGTDANALAHVIPAAVNSAGAQIQRAYAPISDLPYRALGLGTPAADAAAQSMQGSQQYLDQTTGALPVAHDVASVGSGLLPYVANPYLGAVVSGSNTEQDALAAGMSRTRAALAGAASATLNTVAPLAAKPFAPLAADAGAAATKALGTVPGAAVRGAVEGVPQGAAFAAGQPAVTALGGGDAAAEAEKAPETVGVMAALSALFHTPAGIRSLRAASTKPSQSQAARADAPTEPNLTPTPERPAEPVRPAAEPAAPESAAPGVAPTPEPAAAKPVEPALSHVRGPATPEEATQFSVEHANAQGGGDRPAPPYKTPLGQRFDNLPNGESGRLVDYVPAEEAKTSGRKALRYKFRLDTGEEVTYKASELQAHEEENGLVAPRAGDYEPVVVKRSPVPQRAEPRAPEAPPAPEAPAAPDEPRPFERQPDGQVAEVQKMAEAAQKRFAAEPAKPSMAAKWLAREKAKPTPDPERVKAYQGMVDKETPQAPVAPTRAENKLVGGGFVKRGVEPSQKKTEPMLPRVEPTKPVEVAKPVEAPKPRAEEQPVPEPADTVEHRAREYGLTKDEAKTVEGVPGASDHPDIPEHVRGAAEYVAGKKYFESHDQWKQWWSGLPSHLQRGVRELTGGGHTSTDEMGHVVAAGQRPVSVPPERPILVGKGKKLKMAVRALDADANISYTAGSEGKGNVETLPRYYIGQITDPGAPPGARGKWTVLDWNPNNDEHVQQARGQRVPFHDIPTLKAIGGNAEKGLLRSDIYDSYSDAKNAALDIVAKTKRNRDFNAAEVFGKKDEEAPQSDGRLTQNDPVSPTDISSGRASFRTREQITGENPLKAGFVRGEGEQFRYDAMVDDTIKHLEKLREAGKDPAKDETLDAAVKAIDGLGRRLNQSRRGGTVDWINEVLGAVERFASYVAQLARRAVGGSARKLSSAHRTAMQVLTRLRTAQSRVSQEFRETALHQAQKTMAPDAIRQAMQVVREAGPMRTPLRKQLVNAMRTARGMRRWFYSRFRHLDMSKPQHARFANKLRLAMDAGEAAKNQAAVAIAHYTAPVRKDPAKYALFSDKIILSDLVRQVEESGDYGPNDVVPFTGQRVRDGGLDTLKAALKKVNEEAAKHPEVGEAFTARQNEWFDNVTGPLAALGELPAHLADPERVYFHHQAMKYNSDEVRAAREMPANQRIAGARPSAFKRRTGAPDEYNTAFEEAELASMSQSLAALNRKVFDHSLDDVSKHEEIQDEIHEWNGDKFDNLVHDADPAVTDAVKALGKDLSEGLTIPPKYKKYQSLFDDIRDGKDVSNHEDLPHFLGDVVPSRDYVAMKMKQRAVANQYRDPQDMYAAMANGMTPEDYLPVQTENGNELRVVDAVRPDVAELAREDGEARLRARDLSEVIALAGIKHQRLIPKEFVDQMGESLTKKPTTGLEKIAPPLARNLIHNPLVLPMYLMGNMTTNASMAWLSNPLVFRKIPAAIKLLSKFHYHSPTNAVEKKLLDEMVANRVVQQHFAGQFDDQAKAALEGLARHSKRAGFSANTWMERARWVSSLYRSRVARPLAAMVDDVFKAASYLHHKDVENGKFSSTVDRVFGQRYGGAPKSELVMADGDEAAGIRARSDFVDYGAVSGFADSMLGRRGLQPFYTWVEGEAKWGARMIRNSVAGDKIGAAADVAKLAAKVVAMHALIALWNEQTHSDETKKAAKDAGIDPLNNLILNRGADGRVRYIPAPVVTSDLMRRMGLGDFYNKWKDTVGGESSTMTVGELLAKAPAQAMYQQAASVTPLVSVPVALGFGVRANPKTASLSAVQPGEAWKVAISGLGMRAVATALDDAPRPQFTLADLVSRATDPEDTQYFKARALVGDWKRKEFPNDATPPGIDERSLSANALHDMKAAMKLGDTQRAAQALNQYYYVLSGGAEHTPAQVKQSLSAMAPTTGLGDKKAAFEASLTKSERETWDKANSEFSRWTDPYRNPQMAKVLDLAAGADMSRYHGQTKLYANEVAGRFNALKSQLVKSGADDQAKLVGEIQNGLQDTVNAKTFQGYDTAATKMERAATMLDPASAAQLREQAEFMREMARRSFVGSRPTTDSHK